MPDKKETVEKLIVKGFRDGSHNFWLNLKHFTILNGELICASGGEPTDEEISHMKKYIKAKKLL